MCGKFFLSVYLTPLCLLNICLFCKTKKKNWYVNFFQKLMYSVYSNHGLLQDKQLKANNICWSYTSAIHYGSFIHIYLKAAPWSTLITPVHMCWTTTAYTWLHTHAVNETDWRRKLAGIESCAIRDHISKINKQYFPRGKLCIVMSELHANLSLD